MPHIVPAPVSSMNMGQSPATQGRNDGLRYLCRPLQLAEKPYPRLVRDALLIASLSVFAFIAWAAFAPISEVARAPGEIIPQGRTRSVQHMDGGIVNEVLVNERSEVEAGQLIMRLDGTGIRQDLQEIEQARIALQLKAERLKAFLENRSPDFNNIPASAEAIQREGIAFRSMHGNSSNEASVLKQQLAQKIESAEAFDSQQATYRRNVSLIGKEVESLRQLHAQGLITETRWLDAQRRLSDAQGQLATSLSGRQQASATINEYKQRIATAESQRDDGHVKELIDTQNQLAQLNERFGKIQERVERLEVRAPVTGIIKGLSGRNPGNVIKPGETLFEIVPTTDTMVADIRISPQDIGQVKLEQPVRIKVSTYDFARYGSISGKLSMISATTFTDEKGQKYFSATVALDRNELTHGTHRLELLPGMTIEADIITGKKTVLGYLLKPVRIAFDGALSEK